MLAVQSHTYALAHAKDPPGVQYFASMHWEFLHFSKHIGVVAWRPVRAIAPIRKSIKYFPVLSELLCVIEFLLY